MKNEKSQSGKVSLRFVRFCDDFDWNLYAVR